MVEVFNAFGQLQEDMTKHMQQEEMILFPRIRMIELYSEENSEVVLNRSYLEMPISMMEQEHEHAGALLQQIRTCTNNYSVPAQACTTFRLTLSMLKAFEEDLHQHVHLENNILFPKALKPFQQPSSCSLVK